MKKTIRVSAAIIRDRNRVFTTQRGYGEFKGWWEFPGGKIEFGESAEEALKREIKEELDAEINIEKKLATVEWDYPDFHLSMDCFLCTLAEGGFTLLEANDAAWLTRDTIYSVKWLPADLQILDKITLELLDTCEACEKNE